MARIRNRLARPTLFDRLREMDRQVEAALDSLSTLDSTDPRFDGQLLSWRSLISVRNALEARLP